MNNDLIKNWLEKQSALVVDVAIHRIRKTGLMTMTWSAMAWFMIRPVVAVHLVIYAGANIAITDSCQANIPAFVKAGNAEQSGKMILIH